MTAPTLTEQLQQILSLKAVKNAAFTKENGRQVFYLELNKLVVRTKRGKFKLPNIKFKFTKMHLDFFADEVLNEKGYVHPHISRINKLPCWGNADTRMREALRRDDWITFTHVVIRWAATVDLLDSYTVPSPWRWSPFRKVGFIGKTKNFTPVGTKPVEVSNPLPKNGWIVS